MGKCLGLRFVFPLSLYLTLWCLIEATGSQWSARHLEKCDNDLQPVVNDLTQSFVIVDTMDGCRAIVLDTERVSKYIDRPFPLLDALQSTFYLTNNQTSKRTHLEVTVHRLPQLSKSANFQVMSWSYDNNDREEPDDGFGAKGQFGLGRTWGGASVRPSLTFSDLAPQLTFARRVWIFWLVVNEIYDDTPVIEQFLNVQAAFNKTLSRYHGDDGEMVLWHLRDCSDKMFLRYFKAVMVDTGLPKALNPSPYDPVDESDPPVFEDDFGYEYLCSPGNEGMGCRAWRREKADSNTVQPTAPYSDDEMAASKAMVHAVQEALPQEIYNHFERTYVDKFFAPGRRLYSVKAPIQRLTSRIFLAAWETFKPHVIADNTWVFDGEDTSVNLKYFRTMPDPDVRKVELVLSVRDQCYWCMCRVHDIMTPVGEEPVLWGPDQLEWDILKVMDRYRHLCGMVQRDILAAWKERFDTLAKLPLQYLLLDMREAYALDGRFIGLDAAYEFDDFLHGVPKFFRVRAPTDELAQEIYMAIATPNNERPPRFPVGTIEEAQWE